MDLPLRLVFIVVWLCVFVLPRQSSGQVARPDSADRRLKAAKPKFESNIKRPRQAHFIWATLGVGSPGGEMGKRFGGHYIGTLGYQYLFASKWTIGTEVGFGAADYIRQDPLTSLRDDGGEIIGLDGTPAEISIGSRIYVGPTLKVGKLIVLSTKKRYSNWETALLLQGGAAYLQYQYHFQDLGRSIAQLQGSGIYGYDRLQAGPGFLVEATVMAFAPSGRFSLFGQVGYLGAFTKGQRDFDYNIQRKDAETYYSSMLNVRVGFAFTLFQLDSEEYFYY